MRSSYHMDLMDFLIKSIGVLEKHITNFLNLVSTEKLALSKIKSNVKTQNLCMVPKNKCTTYILEKIFRHMVRWQTAFKLGMCQLFIHSVYDTH